MSMPNGGFRRAHRYKQPQQRILLASPMAYVQRKICRLNIYQASERERVNGGVPSTARAARESMLLRSAHAMNRAG